MITLQATLQKEDLLVEVKERPSLMKGELY